MGLESSETRPHAWVQDIDPALQVFPEALDRMQLGAVAGNHTSTTFGSDIDVMLALRCSSRQIIVADEQLNGPDMMGELLGKGQRVTHQP
jgi:hypothetical protein